MKLEGGITEIGIPSIEMMPSGGICDCRWIVRIAAGSSDEKVSNDHRIFWARTKSAITETEGWLARGIEGASAIAGAPFNE